MSPRSTDSQCADTIVATGPPPNSKAGCTTAIASLVRSVRIASANAGVGESICSHLERPVEDAHAASPPSSACTMTVPMRSAAASTSLSLT